MKAIKFRIVTHKERYELVAWRYSTSEKPGTPGKWDYLWHRNASTLDEIAYDLFNEAFGYMPAPTLAAYLRAELLDPGHAEDWIIPLSRVLDTIARATESVDLAPLIRRYRTHAGSVEIDSDL